MEKDDLQTAKNNLPCLTEADIRDLADDLSFERGMECYLHGAIQEPVRQGSELQGDCEGSRNKPYQVRVVLGENGIVAAYCTCPRGGFCKHIVALLLNYVHRPDVFRAVPPLKTTLASLTRDDLIELVETMVQREPSLMALVEAKVEPAGSSVDVTTLRRQISRAMNRRDIGDTEEDLRDLLTAAVDLSQKEDWPGAGTVYQEVLSALATSYDADTRDVDVDEEDALAAIANDCVDGLRECLGQVEHDHAGRQAWLAALLEAQLTDINLGGVGFASGASQIVTEQAAEEEWPPLERRLLEAVPGSNEWKSEAIVDILVGWNDGHGRHDQAKCIVNEFGTTEQRAFVLARDGKPDEAVALAAEHFSDRPGPILRLADALVESGAEEVATAFLTRQTNSSKSHPAYTEWLALRYCKDNDFEAALTWQRAHFMERPEVGVFKALREIALRNGRWDDVRASALKELERKGLIGPLIEIALHEGNAKRALELLPLARRHWCDYREQVARVAEKEQPNQAIELYRSLAKDAIDQRHRQGYARAAGFLRRTKMLLERAGRQEECQDYLVAFRKEHLRLRALMDELKRAGL